MAEATEESKAALAGLKTGIAPPNPVGVEECCQGSLGVEQALEIV